jgi:TPR repeat protein
MTASANQGHRGAITDLGFYYSQVTVDLAKADQYFLVSAKCGSLDAQVELGFNYEFARGVEWNRKQAIYWLMQAAPHFGKAGYAAQWLQDPATPHFQNVDQLSNYISAKINQRIVLSLPRNRGPIPGTPGCYANINPACANDPTSAAYKANHPQ